MGPTDSVSSKKGFATPICIQLVPPHPQSTPIHHHLPSHTISRIRPISSAIMTSSTRQAFDWSVTDPAYKPEYMRFASRRSTVMGSKGVVACSQPLASSAGIEILNKGGNAADAAVAVAAALNVTEPCNTGIGGDAFCLFYDAKNRKVRAFNGSGRAPAAMTLEKLRAAGITGDEIPHTSLHSVTVPGAASAWVDTVERLGSGNLTLSDILAPAIRLAENGYPVHESTAYLWNVSEKLIKQASPNANEMLLNGKAPAAAELMRMPNLARTFRELATKGKDGFYRGRVAEAIVELIKSKGGLMELDDLAAHAEKGTEEVTPISYTYNHPAQAGDLKGKEGVTLYECPPNGQGLTALIALGILDQLQDQGLVGDLAKIEHNSAEYLHALIEALRLAFADTRYFVADPAHSKDMVAALLSKEYLAERAKLFNPNKASVDLAQGSPANTCDTVYFTVTDGEGNACSFINSNCTFCHPRLFPLSCLCFLILILTAFSHRRWIRYRCRAKGLRLYAAEPWSGLCAARWTPELRCAIQATIPHYHPCHGAAGRRAVPQLRCDGKLIPRARLEIFD